MDRKRMILAAAVFVGVLLAGVLVARPGVLSGLNPTSAVAASAHSLFGGENDDDDDDDEAHHDDDHEHRGDDDHDEEDD